MIRYAFFGTPTFARTIVEHLDRRGFRPLLVVTQPDRPKGRGRKCTPPPVALWALENEVRLLQPERGNDPELLSAMRVLSPDVAVTAAYGALIPEALLSVPKRGFLNVHPSLLPRYRGASPIQAALLNGDQRTGVTLMQMDRGLDTGPLIASVEAAIEDDMDAASLTAALADIGGELVADKLEDWVEGRLEATPQDPSRATMTRRLSKEDGHIDFSMPAEEVRNAIRAMTPWPSAYADMDGARVKILKARLADDAEAGDGGTLPPGSVVVVRKKRLFVRCGSGWIELLSVQMPSKAPVRAEEVAHNIKEGSRFRLPSDADIKKEK